MSAFDLNKTQGYRMLDFIEANLTLFVLVWSYIYEKLRTNYTHTYFQRAIISLLVGNIHEGHLTVGE